MQLNREYLEKQKYEVKKVVINGLDIYLRKMSVRELKRLASNKNNNEMDQMIEAIIYCCVDEEGKQLFDRKEDRALILDQGIDLINKIFSAIMNHCNIQDDAIDKNAKN